MPSPNIVRTQDAQPADGETLLWACDQRDARTLSPGLLNDGLNLRYTNGLPETRKGVIKPAWANVTSLTDTVVRSLGTPYGSGVFRDPNSVEYQLAAAGGLVWAVTPHNQNVTVPLPAGVAILGACKFVQAFDRMFLFRGRYLAPLVLANLDTGFTDILPLYNAAAAYNATVVATGQAADEIAYGPFQAVTSITRVGNLATVITPVPHGYITGADITLTGANQSAYNGRFNITVVDDSTFTFFVSGVPTTPATGTIKGSNMIYYWKALGSRVTLTSLTSSSTTATATKNGHGFSSGQYVTISGAVQSVYNGTYQITVVDANTFTYTFAGSSTTPATGTILAQTSVVFAGQSPDTNPEAWTRSYNILPNADTALFFNDLLLVPTAYEPASADNYTTFNGGAYKKRDYIVATNYLDYIHFSFANEFRINSGSADEIVDLLSFGTGSVIVLKDKSYAVLSNIALDLSQVSLNFLSKEFGCVGRGACCVAGSNAYFLSSGFGVVVIRQSDLGVLLSVDVPLSAAIPRAMNGIDWTQAPARARMAHWDNKLYISCPRKDGTTAWLVYDFIASVRLGNSVWETGVMVQGWTPLDTGAALDVLEFHRLNYNGQDRLFFLDTAGYVNLVEESDRGDQIANPAGAQGLSWVEIESYALSRAYEPSLQGQVRPVEECISLMTWNPRYTVRVIFPGANLTTTLVANKTRDNTIYTRPFDAAAWDASNVNDDWDTPYRQDYSVSVPVSGMYLGSGVILDQFQEALDTRRVSGRQSKSFQLEFSNTQGRVRLVGQRVSSAPGRDRRGVLT